MCWLNISAKTEYKYLLKYVWLELLWTEFIIVKTTDNDNDYTWLQTIQKKSQCVSSEFRGSALALA